MSDILSVGEWQVEQVTYALAERIATDPSGSYSFKDAHAQNQEGWSMEHLTGQEGWVVRHEGVTLSEEDLRAAWDRANAIVSYMRRMARGR
jgi:hypothetical protein